MPRTAQGKGLKTPYQEYQHLIENTLLGHRYRLCQEVAKYAPTASPLERGWSPSAHLLWLRGLDVDEARAFIASGSWAPILAP